MELVAVDSSNVWSVGYEPETRLLRIVFRDHSIYDAPDTPPELHQALMAARSKGSFVAQYLSKSLKRSGGPPEKAPACPELPSGARDLQTYEPDDCCAKHIAKAIAGGQLDTVKTWTCPMCGTEWKAEAVGDLWHWSPHPAIMIF